MKLAKENLGKVSVTVEKAYHSVDKEYDKLVVVEEEGQFRTFISRKPVPIGTELTDREFWLPFSSVKESIVIDYNKFKQYIRTGEGLLDNSIVTRHIKDRNVTGDKIAEATITFVNIADEGVTLPKINKEAIDTTLTKEGHLAEAKHTGERLLNIEGLSVIKIPSTQSTVLDAWQIIDKKGNVHGVTINTYKDKSIDAIWLSIHEEDSKPENPEVKVDNPRYLNIIYNKADGTQQKVSIPLASFVTEAEFSKNGFKVIDGVVNLKISSDITTSRYFHFDADGNITLDGFEERILEDLGTFEHSQPRDGTMWGEFKEQEKIREQVSNSAHQVFSDNWDEQDDDPEDYDPLAVTEASYAYNWKSVTNPNKTGNIEDLVNKVDALAVGIFYGYAPNENELPQNIIEKGYAYVGTDNPYKIYNFDGTQWKDSNTTIQATSEADEEDITYNENDKLTFKDRNNTDGMGYVILRKNKSFAEQVNKSNTIYEIRYNFDINGAEITIPKGCVLKFNGGKLSNGKISFNKCELKYSNIELIFDNIIIVEPTIENGENLVSNSYLYADFFYKDDIGYATNSVLKLCKECRYLRKEYNQVTSIILKNNNKLYGTGFDKILEKGGVQPMCTSIKTNLDINSITANNANGCYISNLYLENTNKDNLSSGIYILNCTHWKINCININSFDIGICHKGGFGCVFDTVLISNSYNGLHLTSSSESQVNGGVYINFACKFCYIAYKIDLCNNITFINCSGEVIHKDYNVKGREGQQECACWNVLAGSNICLINPYLEGGDNFIHEGHVGPDYPTINILNGFYNSHAGETYVKPFTRGLVGYLRNTNISGFKIANTYYSGTGAPTSRGMMYLKGNCHIDNVQGGMAYVQGDNITIKNCRFEVKRFGGIWTDGNYYPNNHIQGKSNIGTTQQLNDKGTELKALENNNYIGLTAFNTTINKPVWWTGTNWIDATGADV